MAQDPKKPAEKTEHKPPATDQIPAEEMTYPTPELDPKTGAPVDTRFQHKEAAVQQPPKSEAKETKDEDDEDDDETPKDKKNPHRRR